MSEKTIYRKDIDRLFDEGLDLKRLNGKTILVVGATGLIGSCVVDVLMLNPDRGYRVVAAGRNRLRAKRSLLLTGTRPTLALSRWMLRSLWTNSVRLMVCQRRV